MPGSITHQLIAEEVLARLPELDVDKPMFFFGAQGGDVCFFCGWHEGVRGNLGKALHRENIYRQFRSLGQVAAKDRSARSYALGYVTHYVADVVFHPFVYAMVQRETERGVRDNVHFLVEGDLDVYFLAQKRGMTEGKYLLPYTRKELAEESLFAACSALAAAVGKKLTRTALRRGVSRYFLYLRHTADVEGKKQRFFAGAEKLLHLPHRVSAIYKRSVKDATFLNEEKDAWTNPASSGFVSTESAAELFSRAVDEGETLCRLFLAHVETGEELPERLFEKNFLTGV